TNLVSTGYYDGSKVFAVQDGVYFMGGAKTSDGTDNNDTDKTELAAEKSKDLWPFYGAIAAYGNRQSLLNSQIKAGSRCLFIGSIDFDEKTIAEMNEASDNKQLNGAFAEKGGVPNFSQQYTIFAQVYDGFEAYEKLISSEVVKPSESDGSGDSDLRPKNAVTFERVYLSTYGENKNDDFFTLGSSEK
ncbi:MAG: peptidylprolyl isomerase, partial [Ruminococcus sp.]|nr:peptidylprolyl isomerase [Ruminococcus sp.]